MALMKNNPTRTISICAMEPKSIVAPGTPWYLAISPSNSLVVASPMIFGPTMLNSVLSTAAMSTTISGTL